MTNLEGNDLQTKVAAFDMSAAAGGKFQEDYFSTAQNDAKFVPVAYPTNTDTPISRHNGDRVQVAQAGADDGAGQAPAAGDDDGKFGVKELLSADPKDLPPSLKTLQGLADHFDKASDKSKAIGEVKPEVEKAVKAADDDLAATKVEVEKLSTTLKPKFEAVQTELKTSLGKLQDAVKAVPQADVKHVASEVSMLMDPQTSPGLKKALEADLAGHKGLVPAVKDFAQARKDAEPIEKQVGKINEKVKMSSFEPIAARMVYADMLEQSGDKAGAKNVNAESMALQMGMSIEQFHQLQKLKEDQEKKNAPSSTAPAPADAPSSPAPVEAPKK